MIDNTIEEKSVFFATFLWQKVYRNLYWVKEEKTIEVSGYILGSQIEVSNGYLLLTPLSMITDEHAEHIAKMNLTIEDNKFAFNGKQGAINYGRNNVYFLKEIYKIAIFLISKGYYVGDGVEIQMGWVKLKEAQ